MEGRWHFLGIPRDYARYETARFVVVPAPWDRAGSGTRYGPSAILEASHQIGRFDEELGFEPWKAGIHTLPPAATARDPEGTLSRLADLVEKEVRAGKFPIVLGGDRLLTEGSLAGVARVHAKISVLHLDAHGRSDGGKGMSAIAERIVQVGVRTVAEPCTPSKRIQTWLVRQERDVRALVPKMLEGLGEMVYLSLNLHALDPSIVPGVRVPVPGGLGWWDALEILRAVTQARNVVAADVVELCPLPDSVVSEFAAAQLVYRLMGYVVHKDTQKSTVRRVVRSRGKR